VDVEVRHSDGKTELLWRLKEEMAGEARESEGLYLLRTNMAADSAENLWKGYMTLTRVESVFRSLKQELRLRPVFHQKTDRMEAHILLSYIAYVLLWSIEHTHRRCGRWRHPALGDNHFGVGARQSGCDTAYEDDI